MNTYSFMPGNIVKIQRGVKVREKFWVKVMMCTAGRYIGVIDNILIGTNDHGLSYGDQIEFTANEVIEVYHGC